MTPCRSFGAGVGVDGVDTAAACLRVLMLDMLLIEDSSQSSFDTVACLTVFRPMWRVLIYLLTDSSLPLIESGNVGELYEVVEFKEECSGFSFSSGAV
jgi:hypothetical protein